MNEKKINNLLTLALERLYLSNSNIEIHNLVQEVVTELVDAEYTSIWTYDNKYLKREQEDGIKKVLMSNKEGLLYQCFMTQKVAIHNYLSSTKGYVPHVDNPDNIKIKSKIMMPITLRDTFMGIFTVYTSTKKKKKFTTNDVELLSLIRPLIIEAMFKINHNDGNHIIEDKRKSTNNKSAHNRRLNDMMEKIHLHQEVKEEILAPQEILNIASNIVHDIRTPANGLLGFLEILGENIEDKRLKKYISHAQESALLIETLTTSILDGVSENKTPVMSDKYDNVKTHMFFANIAEVFSANMYKKNIHYTIFIDPYLPKEIELNTIKMKRVILNLIGNASKFTPENASIAFTVKYLKEKQKLYISVKDTGIGIAQEKQSEIFEAFKQAETSTKEKFGGTGLGLSISAAYVREMQGELLLESELDKGSNFYFEIPLKHLIESQYQKSLSNKQASICILCSKKNTIEMNSIAKYLIYFGFQKQQIHAVTSIQNIPDDTSHIIIFENKLNDKILSYSKEKNIKKLIVEEKYLSLEMKDYPNSLMVSQYSYYGNTLYAFMKDTHTPKILIVEDDKISSMLLKAIFEEEDCEVDVAHNGEEGKILLLKNLSSNTPYDLVYTDKKMPLLSGIDMINAYREIESKKGLKNKLKAISISGDPSEQNDNNVFDFFATKPFKKKEILGIFHDNVPK